MRKWIGVSVVSAAMLVGGGIWARAQNPRILPAPPSSQGPLPPDAPEILSGSDVGFRVSGWEGDTPVGRWVVRSNGKWVEPKTMGGLRRLTSR